ncbi:hypothetical protein BK709_19025 [Bacillus thuringiensis serovar shandongiensis]|nr:hypothetical protein IEI_03075 [Bacillus wiedmannii]OTX40559.1 hypothetical protein BK717_04435 [Bacillus thuringiensis serovar malayensis]OUB04978.1 hypothetical protein BK709_19025 [Bacillus thuringiensis serovar shandongiensis]
MDKAYLHYLVRWRFKGTSTVLITHHIASCRDGKQAQHGVLLGDAYRGVYDSGNTQLISINCTEVSEGEYTLLKQKHMEVD